MNAGCSQGRWSQSSISLAPQACWAPLARPSPFKVSWFSVSLLSCVLFPEALTAPACVTVPPPSCLTASIPGGPGFFQSCAHPAPLLALLPVVRPAPALAMPHTEGSSLRKKRSPSELYLLIWKAEFRVVLRAHISNTRGSKSSGLGTPWAFLPSQGLCPSQKLPPEPVICATNWPPHAKSGLLRLDQTLI